MPDGVIQLAACPPAADLLGGDRVADQPIVPALGEKQPPVDRRRGVVGDQVHADTDLAVAGLAQRPAVHPRDSRRVHPVLGKAHVVDHERVRTDRLLRPPRQPFADLAVVPGRGGDELLQALVVHAQPRRHGLHRLALTIQQQPAHVQLTRRPLIGPGQPAQHLGCKRLQPWADLLHLLWCHSPNTPQQDEPNKALLESRSSSHAACWSAGWRAMTCRLWTTATRRRSNRFLRVPT
jgi:hypothetical protein